VRARVLRNRVQTVRNIELTYQGAPACPSNSCFHIFDDGAVGTLTELYAQQRTRLLREVHLGDLEDTDEVVQRILVRAHRTRHHCKGESTGNTGRQPQYLRADDLVTTQRGNGFPAAQTSATFYETIR